MVPSPEHTRDTVQTVPSLAGSWAFPQMTCVYGILLIAREQGIDFSFTPNEAETDVHPNTVDIHMVNEQGQEMTVRGESLGGGKVRIVEINHVKVDFTGEYSAIIVIHQDTPGVVAYITRCLSERNINIAFMRLFRESKGTTAYTIVESDGHLPEDIVESIHRNTNIHDVMVVQM